MASRKGATQIIININECEGFLNMLGKGLHSIHQTYPELSDDVEVDLGKGLLFDEEDKVALNTSPTKQQTITVLKDVDIQLDKYSLTLTKTFTDLVFDETEEGVVVGVHHENTRSESETVTIPEGYGYTSILSTPLRQGTPNKPNFYAK
jgi:hypothetical protein